MVVIQFIASEDIEVGNKQIGGFVNGGFEGYAKGRATIARASVANKGLFSVTLPGDVVFIVANYQDKMPELFNRAIDDLLSGGDINKYVLDSSGLNSIFEIEPCDKFLVSLVEINRLVENYKKNQDAEGAHK